MLREVTFELRPAEVLWLRGANGSGKTTLLKILAHVLRPTSGRISFDGTPLRPEHRGQIGFCAGNERSFHLRLSVRENLEIAGATQGLGRSRVAERLGEWQESLGLEVEALLDQRASGLSTGQRERIGLLRALIHRPRIALLDEPARSQDEAARAAMWRLLEAERARGLALIVAAHEPPALEGCVVRWLADGTLREAPP